MSDAPAITPGELHERLRRGDEFTLLDVRDRDEFEAWRIDASRVVQTPYAKFMAAKVNDDVSDLAADLELFEPVVAVCPQGEASDRVAGLLREEDIDAVNLEDGMEGWARIYVAREMARYDGPGTVVQYERPSSGCLAYLLVSGTEAAVVDPLRAFADRYVADAEAQGATLVAAIDTHVHADHVSGVREVAAASGADRVLPEDALDRGLAFDARTVEDGDEIAVGDAALSAMAAPGHTTEMTLFRVGDCLLSADTLFLDGIGRPDLEGGSGEAADLAGRLYDTLSDRVLALPDETLVAPGHVRPGAERADDGTYTARLSQVREAVALLDADLDREAFVERVATDLPPRPANYEEIVAVNLGTSDADDETAFELELGPNNCAV